MRYQINTNLDIADAPEIDAKAIAEQFKANGFNVNVEAILNNFNAWRSDYKSLFRDDENGYLLFTPCGCNPLSFDCEELNETNNTLQTYIA